MHSAWVRANSVVFYGLAVLAVLCFFCHMSAKLLPPPEPLVDVLRVNALRKFNKYRGGIDKAVLTYDLTFDLTTVFHWNVKLLFVFLTAEYVNERNTLNQVIVYDQIITSPEDAYVDVVDIFNKYNLVDDKDGLRDTDIVFKLSWDIMPLFGPLGIYSRGEYHYKLPPEYKR